MQEQAHNPQTMLGLHERVLLKRGEVPGPPSKDIRLIRLRAVQSFVQVLVQARANILRVQLLRTNRS